MVVAPMHWISPLANAGLSMLAASRLPEALVEQLRAYVQTVRYPLAIRSSSKLEDSSYQPFAGVYSTYMIPFVENRDQMLRMLERLSKAFMHQYSIMAAGHISRLLPISLVRRRWLLSYRVSAARSMTDFSIL